MMVSTCEAGCIEDEEKNDIHRTGDGKDHDDMEPVEKKGKGIEQV